MQSVREAEMLPTKLCPIRRCRTSVAITARGCPNCNHLFETPPWVLLAQISGGEWLGLRQPSPRVNPDLNFWDVDRILDNRLSGEWTEAQKQAARIIIREKRVWWVGEVVDASMNGGGTVQLRCNPDTVTSDVGIQLDSTQLLILPLLHIGDLVLVEGTVAGHSMFGWDLSDGHVIARWPRALFQ